MKTASRYPTCPACGKVRNVDAGFDPLAILTEALMAEAKSGKVRFSRTYFKAVSSLLMGGVQNGNTIYPGVEENVQRALRANIWHFSAGKAQEYTLELNKAFRTSATSAEFERRVKALHLTYNRKWLKTEFATASRTAEGIAEAADIERTASIFPYVQWVQIQRTTARKEHQPMHLKVFDVRKGLPITLPADFNCGCRYRKLREPGGNQVVTRSGAKDLLTPTGEWKRMVKYGFDRNALEDLRVFPAKQMYRSDAQLRSIGPEDNGLKPFRLIDPSALPELPAASPWQRQPENIYTGPVRIEAPGKHLAVAAIDAPTEIYTAEAGRALRLVRLFKGAAVSALVRFTRVGAVLAAEQVFIQNPDDARRGALIPYE